MSIANVPQYIMDLAMASTYKRLEAARKAGDLWFFWPEDDWETIGDFDLNCYKDKGYVRADLFHMGNYLEGEIILYRACNG